MKLLVFFSFLLSSAAFSNAFWGDCPQTTTAELPDIKKLMIPNCARLSLQISADEGNASQLCESCKNNFIQATTAYGLNASIPPIELKKQLLNEFKKSLSAQIIDIAKLRSLNQMNTDFAKSNSKCNTEKLCDGNPIVQKQIADLRSQLTVEVTNLVSLGNDNIAGGVLFRPTESSSCNVTDNEIMKAQSRVIEDKLSNGDLISKLANLPTGSPSEFQTKLKEALLTKETSSQIDELGELLLKHPVFSKLVNKPEMFVNFFKTIKKPATPASLRASLYESKNLSEFIDSEIATSCENSIKSFTENFCNTLPISYKASSLSPLIPLTGSSIEFTSSDTVEADPTSLNSSRNTLRLCSYIQSKDTKAKDLSDVLRKIDGNLPEEYASSTLEKYQLTKYNKEIGSAKQLVCSDFASPTQCSPEPVGKPNSLDCKYFAEISNARLQNSPEFRLANSSDPNLNSVLRKLIGNPGPSSLTGDTKRILIAQGIIPQEDGTILAQPDVPERHKDYFASGAAATASIQSPRPASATPSSTTSAAPTRSTQAASAVYRPTDSAAPIAADSDSSTDNLSSNDQSKLADIQSEILRRVSATPKNAPLTSAQVRQIVQDEAARRQVPLTQAQTNAVASNIQSQAQGTIGGLTPASVSNPRAMIDDNTGAVTRTPEQRANDQRNAAIAAAVASRNGSGGGASLAAGANPGADRSTASNPSITISSSSDAKNLPDVIKQKLEMNDLEGKQLKAMVESHQDITLKLLNTTVLLNYVDGKGYQVASANIPADVKTQITTYLNSLVRKTQTVTRDALIQTIRRPQ